MESANLFFCLPPSRAFVSLTFFNLTFLLLFFRTFQYVVLSAQKSFLVYILLDCSVFVFLSL
jgi:hypothetical protein